MKGHKQLPAEKALVLAHIKSSVWNGLAGAKIAADLQLDYQHVMKALVELKNEGKVRSERNGTAVVYRIIKNQKHKK